MRLTEPRLAPLPPAEWDAEAAELMLRLKRDGMVFNIFQTLARHPGLLRRWTVFAGHVLQKSTLPPRDREIVILRMGWLCRAGYEWGHHVAIGQEAGLSRNEIMRIAEGPASPGWDPFEATLLEAVDELEQDSFISDRTWTLLAGRYTPQQLLDLVFTIGQYRLVSMVLNSLGVQLEAGYEPMPEPASS
jgi:4-carboxymuconolactone decarboxylase